MTALQAENKNLYSKAFRIEFSKVTESRNVESNCNGITFLNNGVEDAIVNGHPLKTSEFLQMDGNSSEFDTTNYQIVFSDGIGTKDLSIFRKLYII